VTTFYLIRHGSNDFLPRGLAGRLPDVRLNTLGQSEARRVAERLKTNPIRHLFSSPMERCRETAEPLAQALGLQVQVSEALNEVDFGDWQGAELTALNSDERWGKWNSFRCGHVLPHGETMVVIQARVAGEMIRLRQEFPGEHIALVSHGDPIRAALCYWLGMPLDFLQRLEVVPGSISEVAVGEETAVVRGINVV
jgi:broad specificity phosphatase PhoE